jgi:hypothetical protein
MICVKRPYSALAWAAGLALATVTAHGGATPMARPLAAAYQQILRVMRRPPANGLLVTSVELPASVVRIGVQPGDIITQLAGHRMNNSAALTTVLQSNAGSRQPLALLVVRGLQVRHIHANIRTLNALKHIGVIGVRAGAPAPLNPPATARDKLKLMWSRVQTLEPRGREAAGGDTWMLVFYHQLVVGAIRMQVSHLGPTWKLLWNQEAVSGGPLSAMAWRMAFIPGDHQQIPAVRITHFTRWQAHGVVQGRRVGDTFYVSSVTSKVKAPRPHRYRSADNAAPLPLLALVASALPPHHGLVLPVTDLAQRTLETRLGCVMTMSRRQEINFAGAGQRVRVVRMLWMDVPRNTFWISPRGTLLGMKFGNGFSAYRVAGAAVVQRIIPKSRLMDVLPEDITITSSSGD